MKLHLTEKALREMAWPANRTSVKVFDTEVSGFGAQLTKPSVGAYFVSYRDEAGTQRQEKIGKLGEMAAHTARGVARLRLEEIRKSKGAGQKIRRASGQTVSEFFHGAFIDKLRSEQRNYETHASLYRNHIEAALGAIRLDDVTEGDVLELQDALRRKPVAGGKWKTQQGGMLADTTVKRIMILVRHLFNVALQEKVPGLTVNPTRHLRLTAERKIKGHFMSKEQIKRLIEVIAARDLDFLDAVVLLAITGMRRSNVFDMRWDWVDLSSGIVKVPAACDKAGKGFEKVLSNAALEVLKRRFATLEPGQMGAQWVFPNPKTGKPYSSRRSLWETCRREAGMEKLRYHDLRHTFATMMLEAGADIVDVQKALGHTQLSTTTVYLHVTTERSREKANAASAQMGF